MIVAKRKPIEEIIEEAQAYEKILLLGCNECVTVCEAGVKRSGGFGLRPAYALHEPGKRRENRRNHPGTSVRPRIPGGVAKTGSTSMMR